MLLFNPISNLQQTPLSQRSCWCTARLKIRSGNLSGNAVFQLPFSAFVRLTSCYMLLFRFCFGIHHTLSLVSTVFCYSRSFSQPPLEMYLSSAQKSMYNCTYCRPGGHDWGWTQGACGCHNQGGSGALYIINHWLPWTFFYKSNFLYSHKILHGCCMWNMQVLQADLASVKEVTLERLRSLVSALPPSQNDEQKSLV